MQIKKTVLILIIFGNILLFAQDGSNNQGIELPAFVITGIQAVSVPIIDKKKSEFVPILGNSFLIPNYNAEEFSLMDNTSPIKKEIQLNSTNENYNGLLQLGAGLQTLPIGDLYLGFNKSDYLFNSHIFGRDTRKYLPYAGYNTSGANAKFNYFVNHKSDVLPGLSLGVEGNFVRDLFYYYGTADPSKSRENEYYGGKLFFSNQLNKNFKYGIDLSSKYLNMKKDDVFENVISSNAFVDYRFGSFGISGSGTYQIQQINENLIGNKSANYFGGKAYFQLLNSKIFELKLGAQYSQLDTDNIFSPIAIFSVYFDKGLALFMSYEGNSELVTLQTLITENRYFEKSVDNIFMKKKFDLRFAVKYDFSDMFDINAGLNLSKFDNYHFFEDLNNDNIFNIVISNDINELSGFMNMLINTKKFGEFFASVQFQNVTDINDFKIPYKPELKADVFYGYMFNFGLYSKLKLNYSQSSYTNLLNTQTIPSYIDLGLYLKYSIFDSFALTCDFQNLLNRKDFLWKGYEEKPLDVILGIEYSW